MRLELVLSLEHLAKEQESCPACGARPTFELERQGYGLVEALVFTCGGTQDRCAGKSEEIKNEFSRRGSREEIAKAAQKLLQWWGDQVAAHHAAEEMKKRPSGRGRPGMRPA